MSDSTAGLRRQIDSATDLQSVVRSMKALAASSIGQYEKSVHALADYYRTVELGLGACFRNTAPTAPRPQVRGSGHDRLISAVVFGSDQGLVGRFNEAVADHAITALANLPGTAQIWAVGERVHARMADGGMPPVGQFEVPISVEGIAPLVGQILVQSQGRGKYAAGSELHLFYNSPTHGPNCESVSQRLLPLDENWRRGRASLSWPSNNLPEVIGGDNATVGALIGEFLFVSLFRACAESLASENASRLAAMERADKNIDALLERLRGNFNRLRQDSIDEELFDVIAGFEALIRL